MEHWQKNSDIVVRKLSRTEFGFRADIIPSGIPRSAEITTDSSASFKVVGNLGISILTTGC